MTAIDFATLFCGRLLKSTGSLAENGVLCALASGLNNAADISHTIGLPPSNITTTLHRLAKKNLAIHIPTGADAYTIAYTLTHAGKDTVANLINFLPKQH